MRTFLSAALLSLISTFASASVMTVEEGATRIGDGANIVGIGGASISSLNPAYDNSPTVPTSDWVWIGDINSNNAASWKWDFDLTGFDPATALISGVWAADNNATALLNGSSIQSVNEFRTLSSFNYTGATFTSGANSLVFNAVDTGGPAAFRASLTITATPVPLPAGLPLALFGIAALGGLARRARKSA